MRGLGSSAALAPVESCFLRDKTSWPLTETQVRDMVTEILCDAKIVDFEAFTVEEISGQRHDVCGRPRCRRRQHGCCIDPS
jgi:hypothetical protein